MEIQLLFKNWQEAIAKKRSITKNFIKSIPFRKF